MVGINPTSSLSASGHWTGVTWIWGHVSPSFSEDLNTLWFLHFYCTLVMVFLLSSNVKTWGFCVFVCTVKIWTLLWTFLKFCTLKTTIFPHAITNVEYYCKTVKMLPSISLQVAGPGIIMYWNNTWFVFYTYNIPIVPDGRIGHVNVVCM
jgi:hypothetical protein